MARLRESAGRPEDPRDVAIRHALLWARLHGVTALREDWHGTVRPLTGPCRLAVVDGAVVTTDEAGTDEENERTLRALDADVIAGLWRKS